MQSQALETIQDRLREAEIALKREQDSYHQMQVLLMSYFTDKSRIKPWKLSDLSIWYFCRVNIMSGFPKWNRRDKPSQRPWLQLSGEAGMRN